MKNRYLLVPIFLLLVLITSCSSAPKGEITLHYADNAQFELINSDGNRVLIDIYNPNALSAPPQETDVLLTTHGHPDHIESTFINKFPGQQLYIRSGKLNQSGISIVGIPSTHTAFGNDEFQDENGTNYIFLIEMGGMRIAHFGDIGQDELTQEQLEALGEVDIALTQFVNSFSQMDTNNNKGFNLMDQVNPKLIIPTHGNGNMDAMGYANEIWEAYTHTSSEITFKKADLEENTKFVIMGVAANSMQTIFDLPDWDQK